VERDMQVFLEDFQDTVAPLRVKMYLLVDFDSSESASQFALLYPSYAGEYFLYLKAYSLLLDTLPTSHNRAVQWSLGLLVYLLNLLIT